MAIINMISGKVPMTYRGMKTMLLIQGSSAYGNSITSSNINNFKTVGRGVLSGSGSISSSSIHINNGLPMLSFDPNTFSYADPSLVIETGPFTVEGFFFAHPDTNTGVYFYHGENRLLSVKLGGAPYLHVQNANTPFEVTGGEFTFYHYAFVGDGNQHSRKVKFFFNGTLKASMTYNYSLDFKSFKSGLTTTGSLQHNYARFTELRISNVARYTGDFTPPTAPFAPD